MIHAVIMAGGGGTRFWPRSRRRCPKQYLRLFGERSLLQQAVDRIEAVAPAERTLVVTSAEQRPLVCDQLREFPGGRVVGEPFSRDTAACLGLAAALIARDDPEGVMIGTPADHIIEPAEEFRRAVLAGAELASEFPTALITLGVPPQYPATGYGYIHRGQPIQGRRNIAAYRIQAFKEKPDSETAEAYVQSGHYYWNSGIFIARAATLLRQLHERQPALHHAVLCIAGAWNTPRFDEVFAREYEPLPKISIDYAVMEGCQDGIVLHAPFRWDDVGSWGAIERMNPQDADGNTVLGEHCGVDTRDCLIVGDDENLIATAGVSNLVIVRDGNAVLVADKRDETAVKKLVDRLKAIGRDAYL